MYLERMREQLPLRDGLNCKRTYDAIVALNGGSTSTSVTLDALTTQAKHATGSAQWPLGADRWIRLASECAADAREETVTAAVHSLVMCGRATEAVKLTEQYGGRPENG